MRQSSYTASSPHIESPKPSTSFTYDHAVDASPYPVDPVPSHAFFGDARPNSPRSSELYALNAPLPDVFPRRKDRYKRLGQRFAFPINLQGPDGDRAMYRQSSAPSLSADARGEEPVDLPSAPAASGSYYSTPQRYSMPLYASELSLLDASVSGNEPALSRVPSRQNPSSSASDNPSTEKTLPPGENNPNTYPGANLCFDYLNKG